MDDDKLKEFMKMDLYELIGVVPTASVKEIKAAYRKKALSCHPDKNPDNPKAAEEFLQLSEILKILIDEGARNAYDQVIKARQQAKVRNQQLDAKRRKFQNDLEAREEAFRQAQLEEKKLKAEIERLEKEGKRQLEEEIRLMQEQIREQIRQQSNKVEEQTNYKVKLKWKADKGDSTNGGYNYDLLYQMLSKYGDIEILLVSSMQPGRGIVEYKSKDAAESAIKIEPGLVKNPLKLIPMWKSKEKRHKSSKSHEHGSSDIPSGSVFGLFASTAMPTKAQKSPILSFSSAPDIFANQPKMSDAEYETSVLGNLRRAEERKRLIEKMKSEEDEEI